jgi:hypothetical protein
MTGPELLAGERQMIFGALAIETLFPLDDSRALELA